jgi:tetratricopeptide (TPR) repeat protein
LPDSAPSKEHGYVTLIRLVTVVSLALIVLHLVAFFLPNRWLWGVYHSAVVPVGYVLFVAALVVILCIPGLNSIAVRAFDSRVKSIATRLKEYRLVVGIVVPVTALIVAAIIFRTENHLLGEGYAALAITIKERIISSAAPLTSAFNLLLADILSVEHWEQGATSVFLITSILAGIIYLTAARGFLSLTFKDTSKVVVGLLLVATAPVVQLFLGYTNNYPLLHGWIVLFIYVCALTLRGKQGPMTCLVTFAVGVGLHVSFAAFLPALIWVLTFSHKSPGKKVVYVLASLSVVLMYVIGMMLTRKSLNLFLLPWPSSESSYFLFSVEHFADMANLFLLTVPILGFVFAAQMYLKLAGNDKWERTQRFLVYMSVSALPFVFFIDPTIGAIRDWDLLSLAATPVVFSSVYFLLKKSTSSLKLASVALPILALGLWHTGSWVYSNMDQRRAMDTMIPALLEDSHCTQEYHDGIRLVPLAAVIGSVIRDNRTAMDLANRRLSIDSTDVAAMDILQAIYTNIGDLSSSADILRKMVAIEPENATIKLVLGITLSSSGQSNEAVDVLRTLGPSPGDYRKDFYLGSSYLNLGRYDSALVYLNKVNMGQPANDFVNYKIGMAYVGLSDYETAIGYFHKALSLSPGGYDILLSMGNAFQSMRQRDSATVYYKRAIRVNDQRLDAHSSLAFLEMDSGRYEESIQLWRKCIMLDPKFVHGYFFIGKMLSDLGRQQEALEMWNSALSVQPGFTPALYQSALLYEKLDQIDSVESRLRRIVEADTAAVNDPEISAKLDEYGITRH